MGGGHSQSTDDDVEAVVNSDKVTASGEDDVSSGYNSFLVVSVLLVSFDRMKCCGLFVNSLTHRVSLPMAVGSWSIPRLPLRPRSSQGMLLLQEGSEVRQAFAKGCGGVGQLTIQPIPALTRMLS